MKLYISTILLVSFCLLSACKHDDAPLLEEYAAKDLASYSDQLVAHRGSWAGTGYQENTLDALKCSRSKGFKHVEMDVAMTIDNMWIMHHNSDIWGYDISSYPYYFLWSVASKHNIKITTLDEVLSYMNEDKATRLWLHYKSGDTESLNRILDLYDVKQRTVLIAYSRKDLEYFIEKGCNCMLLCSEINVDYLKRNGYCGADYEYESLLKNPQLIIDTHKAGLIVGCWTVDDEETVLSLQSMGVDFITTNLTL